MVATKSAGFSCGAYFPPSPTSMTELGGVVGFVLSLALVLVLSSSPHAAATRRPATSAAATVRCVTFMPPPSAPDPEPGLSDPERALNRAPQRRRDRPG